MGYGNVQLQLEAAKVMNNAAETAKLPINGAPHSKIVVELFCNLISV